MDRLFSKTIHRRNTVGHTVIEVLMALALTALVFTLIWSFWSSSRKSEEQLATGFSAQQDLVIAMQRIVFELQEGTELCFPRADGLVKSGLAFVNPAGVPIAYFVEPGKDDEPDKLYRVDLITSKKKLMAQNVNYFKVTVEPPAPGKKACLACLNLSILRGKEDKAGKADDYNIVRKVFLRNLKIKAP